MVSLNNKIKVSYANIINVVTCMQSVGKTVSIIIVVITASGFLIVCMYVCFQYLAMPAIRNMGV